MNAGWWKDRIVSRRYDEAVRMVSLQARAVFLDNAVAEFCQRLPHRYKYRNGTRKFLLTRAMRGVLPDVVVNRRDGALARAA